MSLDATQAGTQTTSWLMWVDFANAVRALPTPVCAGGDTKGGWVRPKRGRGSYTHSSGGGHPDPKDLELIGTGNLNLNLSPEKFDANDTL